MAGAAGAPVPAAVVAGAPLAGAAGFPATGPPPPAQPTSHPARSRAIIHRRMVVLSWWLRARWLRLPAGPHPDPLPGGEGARQVCCSDYGTTCPARWRAAWDRGRLEPTAGGQD